MSAHPSLLPSPLPRLDASSARHPAVRPVVGFSGAQKGGYVDPPHRHDRAQFSYRLTGVAQIRAQDRCIILPPGRGVWIPAGVEHEVSCRGDAAYHALYAAEAAPAPEDGVKVIEVTPFLHALFLEFLTFPAAYDEEGREGRVVDLLLQEIFRAPAVLEAYPRAPREPRLQRVADHLRQYPGDPRDIDGWAAVAGMSRRSFTRAFRHDTGLAFSAWRTQLRLTEAVARLEAGQPVARVSQDLGYQAVSAFSASFQRTYGKTPSAVAAAGLTGRKAL